MGRGWAHAEGMESTMRVHGLAVLVASVVLMGIGCGAPDPGAQSEAIAETDAPLSAAPAIHSVHLSTGVRLEYLEQGNPNGDVVIFLHGYTDSHHSFDLNLPRLARRYHVYALDQRGHGGSDKPACCYEQSDFSEDVIAFMNQLGILRATLVGHSMGSFIAHKVAAEHPLRIERLVLIGSSTTVAGNPVGLELQAFVDTLTDPIDPAFVRDFQASTFFRPIPPSFLDTAVSESLRVPATVWIQALDALIAEDHTAELSHITADTLIFWGDQDVFFSADDQARLLAAVPHSTLLVYPDTGHGLHVEQPRKFVHDLERFLR
jgi:pimeloyl-ACP methyl ester carboxylesterase